MSSKGNLITNSHGVAGYWLKSTPGIPHRPVHVAGTRQKKTEYPRMFSDARYVGMRKMQISMQQKTF
jgi:hypothetical protein